MSTSDLRALTVCAYTTVSTSAAELSRLQEAVRAAHPGAALVVSCQRLEAYGTAACECAAAVRLSGYDAVLRLAEVAAGLHSVILGEEQILAQVRAAFAPARGDLRRAADIAVAAARELRAATDFQSHAGALLDRALRLAGIGGEGTLLVLGTGQMARLVASRAPALGFARVVLAGRTPPPAGPWAFVPLAAVREVENVTVVVGCLGSSAGEVPFAALPPVARLAIDLGTPRNFDPADTPVPLVTIASMLADEQQRPHAQRRRAELRGRIARVVARRLGEGANEAPLRRIRTAAERVRRQEVDRALRLHPGLPAEAVDALTRALVNQLLHAPSERLRSSEAAFGEAVADLFAPGSGETANDLQ